MLCIRNAVTRTPVLSLTGRTVSHSGFTAFRDHPDRHHFGHAGCPYFGAYRDVPSSMGRVPHDTRIARHKSCSHGGKPSWHPNPPCSFPGTMSRPAPSFSASGSRSTRAPTTLLSPKSGSVSVHGEGGRLADTVPNGWNDSWFLKTLVDVGEKQGQAGAMVEHPRAGLMGRDSALAERSGAEECGMRRSEIRRRCATSLIPILHHGRQDGRAMTQIRIPMLALAMPVLIRSGSMMAITPPLIEIAASLDRAASAHVRLCLRALGLAAAVSCSWHRKVVTVAAS